MGGEEDGPSLCAQGEDEIADVLASDGIEPAHRLVEDDDLGISDQRLREAEPLHHSLREAPDGAVGTSRKSNFFEQRFAAPGRLRAGEARELSREAQVFDSVQVLVKRGVLREVSHTASSRE